MSKDKIIVIGGKGSAVVIAEQIYDASVKLQRVVEGVYIYRLRVR